MQNLSDNELDNLFRKAAHGEPSYDPAAWNALKKRLDMSTPPRPWMKWIIPGILSLTIMTGSIIVWNHNSTTRSSEKIATETDALKHIPYTPGTTEQSKADKRKHTTLPSDTSALPKARRTPLKERTDPTDYQGLQKQPLPHLDANRSFKDSALHKELATHIPATGTTEEHGAKKHPALNSFQDAGESSNGMANREGLQTHTPETRTDNVHASEVGPSNKGLNTGAYGTDKGRENTIDQRDRVAYVPQPPFNPIDTRTNPAPADTGKTDDAALPADSASALETAIEIDHRVPLRHHHMKASESSNSLDSTTIPPVEIPDNMPTNTVDSASEEDAKQTRHKLGIKLAVSPDYSSVRFTTLSETGTNFGVLAEYHITPHWSVVAGGIWSRKIYSATDIAYNGYPVSRADGDCRILDIPINVNYVFRPHQKFSFYTALGLSTYIMNKEDYVFYVDSGYGSSSYSKHVRGENNELFSIVNIAVGAQQRLTERWTIQLEPFVKVPVKGIGEGELSLNTLGAFFHLKYSFYNVNNP